MDNQLLELAIEALEAQKAKIETAIAELKAEMSKTKPKPLHARKSQSGAMKAYWARKRAGTAKLAAAQEPATVTAKPKPMSAAQKKAISKTMKAHWAKRRAEAAKKK